MKKVNQILILLTTVIIAITLTTSCGSGSSCNSISGTYSGTSEMGYTSGAAKISISSDCSATLSYDQGVDHATENGNIVKDGSSYKFQSTSGGGTYDLSISGNQIILNGYNWKCVMTK